MIDILKKNYLYPMGFHSGQWAQVYQTSGNSGQRRLRGRSIKIMMEVGSGKGNGQAVLAVVDNIEGGGIANIMIPNIYCVH